MRAFRVLPAAALLVAAFVATTGLAAADGHQDPRPGSMARMHAEMVSSSPDMARMHADMVSSNPGMGRMHGQMVSGRSSMDDHMDMMSSMDRHSGMMGGPGAES